MRPRVREGQVGTVCAEDATPLALVVNEYGDLQGLVTLTDVTEAIVGDLPSAETPQESLATRREDGSCLVDGTLPIEKLKELFDISELPEEDTGGYHTAAGFFMRQLGRVPKVADHIEWESLRFEVVDMDRHRIDQLLVSEVKTPEEPSEP